MPGKLVRFHPNQEDDWHIKGRIRSFPTDKGACKVIKRRGFTLIELLVVIAIIAILAAILFPVFAQAREAARKTSCLSNLKQLSLGMMMYVQDYDELFPNWNWTFFCNGGNNGLPRDSASFWTMAIYPYVKSVGVYRCPDDVLQWDDEYSVGCSDDNGKHDMFAPIVPWPNGSVVNFYASPNNPNYVSYGLAENLTGGWPTNKLAAIKTPANWMMFADAADQLADVWVWGAPDGLADDLVLPSRVVWSAQAAGCCMMWNGDEPASWWVSSSGFTQSQLNDATRHRDGENISYVDGHAKFAQWQTMTWQNLTAGSN
jgi:prepilin-type N-terminal cleavage/methylation domain-containing protein/prepilin-type processing-associated H-X9-DG protein